MIILFINSPYSSIAIAYIMNKNKCNFPNNGFVMQLKQYE